MDSIKAAGEVIKKTSLSPPLELRAAIELPSGVRFIASETVRLDLRISLPCGNLSLHNVGLWVVDQHMDELLLGRPLFKCIGLDLDKVLTERYKKGQVVDVASAFSDAINTENTHTEAKLAKILSEMRHEDIYYDPVAVLEAEIANMGNDTEEEIEEAISRGINWASKEGMSAPG